MIVWDSREAEERNARRLLESCTREMVRARRNVRTNTTWIAVMAVLAAVNAYMATRSGLPWVSLASCVVSCGAVAFLLHYRVKFAGFLLGAVERWSEAQDQYDRVFGKGQS